MKAITNLDNLIEGMSPHLLDSPYVFSSVNKESFKQLSFDPLGYFHEQEGITIIARESDALVSGLAFESIWACITLRVNSSLSAVGFIAVIASKLADAGISVNPVSAYHHDHLFVPWEKRYEALDALSKIR